MGAKTGIEWTESTWNPVSGCMEVSPGCDHCYAKSFAERFRGTPGHYYEHGFDVTLRPYKLDLPLRWTKPRRIFVNSMSDLFHDSVPDGYIARVFAVMSAAPQHTFQLLTKRHGRMRSLLSSLAFQSKVADALYLMTTEEDAHVGPSQVGPWHNGIDWPLPNVWLGVSVENQQWANIRIPVLLDTPAAVRFLSMEPLLGSVDIATWIHTAQCHADYSHGVLGDCTCDVGRRHLIDWVIAGGESGRGARPMHPDWVRSLRDQCITASVPFLFKQWGEHAPWVGHPEGEDGPGDPFVNFDGTTGHVWVNEHLGYPTNYSGVWGEHSHVMARVGKRTAGRELDGRTWDEYPGGES